MRLFSDRSLYNDDIEVTIPVIIFNLNIDAYRGGERGKVG
jgi:hypothetical protein